MTTYNINDKINVVLFGDIYDATVTNNNLHNGDYLEVRIGSSHEVIGTADIVGPCSAKVVFLKDGKKKTIECCSPAQAWEYVDKVVTPHGWKLQSVKQGFVY